MYDDPVKVFLIQALRQIPYLAEADDFTITAMAFSMKQDYLEPGAELFTDKDTQECFFIV